MRSNRKCALRKILISILKTISLAFCVGVFTIISYGLIRDYRDGKVIVTSSDTIIGEGNVIEFPSIAICSRKPFKRLKSMITLDDYLTNTENMTNTVLLSGAIVNANMISLHNSNSVFLRVRNILTSKISLCYKRSRLDFN